MKFALGLWTVETNGKSRKEPNQSMTFNLLSVFPQLLPSAIAWAEEQSERTQKTGQPLDTTDWLWLG